MPRAKAAARRKASFAVPGLLVARGTAGIRKAGPELTDSAWIGEGRSSVDLWDEGPRKGSPGRSRAWPADWSGGEARPGRERKAAPSRAFVRSPAMGRGGDPRASSVGAGPRTRMPPERYGIFTGWEPGLRGDYAAQVEAARRFSTAHIELSALSRRELGALDAYLRSDAARALAAFESAVLHGPAKRLAADPDGRPSASDWREIAAQLAGLPGLGRFSGIVLHPDTVPDLSALAPIADRVIFENLDVRKRDCRAARELERALEELPQARFCLDVARAWTIDPTLAEGHRLLERFGERLAHVHVSGIEPTGKHRPTTKEDLARYAPLLERVRNVPWTFESPLEADAR